MPLESKFVMVDGVSTHYLEAGDPRAPHVVLLHGGEFGACAQIAYEATIEPLSREFHVVAPDMLGYGMTDKIVEFGLPHERRHDRRLKHLRGFLAALNISEADFVGNSFGGAILTMDAASQRPQLPYRRIVSISGRAATTSEARAALLGFDGSSRTMRELLRVLFHHKRWLADAYVERRLASALIPGAFEAASSARLGPPAAQSRAVRLAAGDETPYENIRVPVLIAIGANEKCCPGWGPEAADRIADCEIRTFQESAHCCHLEEPARFNEVLSNFLTKPTS